MIKISDQANLNSLKFLLWWSITRNRSSRPEVFSRKGVLKICSKFTGEHPCQSVISIKLLYNFTEIALWHGYSPVNLLHIFRTPFLKNTSEGQPLEEMFVKRQFLRKVLPLYCDFLWTLSSLAGHFWMSCGMNLKLYDFS